MKLTPRKIFIIVILLIIIIIVVFVAKRDKVEPGGLVTELDYNEEGFPVKIQIVTPTTLEKTISVNGTIQAQRDVTLLSKTGGDVCRLPLKMGDAFQTGDTLAELDRETAYYIYNQAEAALEGAEVDYAAALTDLKRFESLFGEGNISEKQLQDVKILEARMKVAVVSAKAAKDIAHKNLKDCAIKAPYAGYAGEIFVEIGEYAAPGQPVIRIVDIDSVIIKIGFTAGEADKLVIGFPVKVEIADFENMVLEGYLDALSPAASLNGTFTGKIVIPNRSRRIKPGLLASVHIITEKLDNIIAVPKTAIIKREGKDIIYLIENGVAQEREIAAGIFNDEMQEITRGISINDTLIVKGQSILKNGGKVVITNL